MQNSYPQQPGAGQPYPGQPYQGQQYQQQPNYQPQPGTPAPGYAPQVNYAPPNNMGAPIGLPATNPVNEAAQAQAYAQHRQNVNTFGGGRPQYVAFLGPQGQKRWDASVQQNYEAAVTLYILPPWAPNVNIFHTSKSHFWKSYSKPQGGSVSCTGTGCLVCKARQAAIDTGDDALKQRAREFATRTRFLYNVALLDIPQAHYDATGKMRPFILQAGSKLHAAIGDLIEARGGAISIVDPTQGRPIRVKKRKTGPLEQNVEYSLVDLNPAPLPQEFYPALLNLWPLGEMDKVPTQEDQLAAVQEMGLPLTGMQQTAFPAPGQMPQPGYGGPRPMQAAYPNPYTPQQTVQPYPMQYQPQQTTVQPYAVQYQPQQGAVQPPIEQWAQQQMAQMYQPAPDAAPPAVRSTAVQTPYSPQPSQGMPQQAQVQQAAQQGTQAPGQAYYPPPPGLAQPTPVEQPARASQGMTIEQLQQQLKGA